MIKLPSAIGETSTVRIDPLHPAAYLVAYHDLTLPVVPRDKVFTYTLASNGIFKTASHRYFTATIPVMLWKLRLPGLQLMVQEFTMRRRLPAILLSRVIADARRAAWAKPVEVMYRFVVDGNKVLVDMPLQIGSAGRVAYRNDGLDPGAIALELHSHHQMAAFFSPTDDADEGGLRLYGVIGRIFDPVPEVRLRVGVYGDFAPVLFEDVFYGDIEVVDASAG